MEGARWGAGGKDPNETSGQKENLDKYRNV